jgi:acyl-coenzyme A thioesterase PaaI-like protein
MPGLPSLTTSLQDRYAPEDRCFGCGARNERGLRIKSRPEGDEVVLDWVPEAHHQGYGGFLNGGIIGTLFDCHSNWTAAYQLMLRRGDGVLPCTVTAEFTVRLRRPTPSALPLRLRARVVEFGEDRAVVEAVLESAGQATATCRGVFVAVKPGHPAYHRW